jgi:hypothetical protein
MIEQRAIAEERSHAVDRLRVLRLVDLECGASAANVLVAIEAEQVGRESATYGRTLEGPERLALRALDDRNAQGDLARLVRQGRMQIDQGKLSSPSSAQSRRAGWMVVTAIVAVLGTAIGLLRSSLLVSPAYLLAFVGGMATLSWWFSRDYFAAARSADNALRSANAALRPKSVSGTSAEAEAESVQSQTWEDTSEK